MCEYWRAFKPSYEATVETVEGGLLTLAWIAMAQDGEQGCERGAPTLTYAKA